MNDEVIKGLIYHTLIYAQESPDPSTQNAAILCNTDGTICAVGVNEFPEGVKNSLKRWTRPLKYSYVEHAERNAIFNAAKSGTETEGLIMVCPWFACADCARAIVQSGIKEVIGLKSNWGNSSNDRWKESCEIGDMILKEGGVKITRLEFDETFGIKLRRNGEMVTF